MQQSNPEHAYHIERRCYRRALDRSVDSYVEHDKVCRLIADSLLQRLLALREVPRRVLLIDGSSSEYLALRKCYPKALITVAHLSDTRLRDVRRRKGWLRASPLLVHCDVATGMPFDDGSFDLLFGNLVLPWIYPAQQFAADVNRVLDANGSFFFTSAGPDTLIELRQQWASIDAAVHINAFPDMHDLADLMLKAGAMDPVVDVERMTLSYSSCEAIQTEMRAMGFGCAMMGRRRGLMASNLNQVLQQRLLGESSDPAARIQLSLEIVFAHGWKGQRRQTGDVHTWPLKDLRIRNSGAGR